MRSSLCCVDCSVRNYINQCMTTFKCILPKKLFGELPVGQLCQSVELAMWENKF